MSFQTVSRTTRHDISIAWYRATDEYKAYLKTNFEDTGKITNIERVFSNGGTSRDDDSTLKTVTVTWEIKMRTLSGEKTQRVKLT